MSVVTAHQTDLTTFCKFKREHMLRRALHLSLNRSFESFWTTPRALKVPLIEASWISRGRILSKTGPEPPRLWTTTKLFVHRIMVCCGCLANAERLTWETSGAERRLP